MDQVLKFVMYGLHTISALVLIGLVVSQTSRHEGLGAVGGSSTPSMRGRAGVEEKLAEYTKYTAIAFMILSLLLYLLGHRFHWT